MRVVIHSMLGVATLIGVAGCTGIIDSLTPKIPDEVPGIELANPDGAAYVGFRPVTWASDSKTFYASAPAFVDGKVQPAIIAYDMATHAPRVVSAMEATTTLVLTPDGGTFVYSATDASTTPATISIFTRPVAGGPSTRITATSASDFLLSPDGSTLAFHPAGSSASTVQLLTLASGARGAITTGGGMPRAFSPDGTQLAVSGPTATTLAMVWHVATGVMDTAPLAVGEEIWGVAWRNGFRVLVRRRGLAETIDRAFAGTESIQLAPPVLFTDIVWLPAVPAVAMVTYDGHCWNTFDDSCLQHMLLTSYTVGVATPIGSINRLSPDRVDLSISPDGQWAVYRGGDSHFRLLAIPPM